MDIKELTQRSPKKEIWEAYQAILDEIKNKKPQGAEEPQQPLVFQNRELLAKESDLNIEKVSGDIAALKTPTL